MKLLVVGGGSGGHVTPAVAVMRKVLEQAPRTQVEFWTDRKYYKNVVKITTEIDVNWGEDEKTAGSKKPYIRIRKLAAGKFRRYHGLTFAELFGEGAKTLRDLTFGNVAGFFGFITGIFQSFWRLALKKNRPDVIFLKGGYVGLPVGIVAKWFKIPYVIHESDAVAGLANRMLMNKAAVVATGAPFEETEERKNWQWVGIPVAPEFKNVSENQEKALKKAAGFDPEKPLLMVTGGSQGAVHINEAVAKILPELLKFTSVGLVAGRKHYEEMIELKKYEEWDQARLKSNFRMWNFSPVMQELLGAADVVISRAGATTIAELAVLGKAVVLIPYSKLPNAHQDGNVERLKKLGAVETIADDKIVEKPEELLEIVRGLMRSPRKRADLAEALQREGKTDAAKRIAEILIEVGGRKNEAR